MTGHTLIICEGAHDLAAIASVASGLVGWSEVKAVPKSLPPDLDDNYPRPRKNKWGAPYLEWAPRYLRSTDHWLEVRARGGDEVWNDKTVELLDRAKPDAVGVVVDANGAGVDRRLEQFRDCFRDLYRHVDEVVPGTVCPGEPRLGLWIAPDNENSGSLADMILTAVSQAKPELTETGTGFIESLRELEPGKWCDHLSKAVLGAVTQTVEPGASLAVTLRDCRWPFMSKPAEDAPLRPLQDFLRNLTSP